MAIAESSALPVEHRPGLVLAKPEPPAQTDKVRTDVGCYMRVRISPVPLDPVALELPDDAVQTLLLENLPGSEEGEGTECAYAIRHRQLDEWQDEVFAGEYRTRQPSLARHFFLNGGKTLHLLDLLFHLPPLDFDTLPEDEDPETGRVSFTNLVLEKGFTTDTALFDWRKEIVEGEKTKQDVSVIVLDHDGSEQIRYNCYKCWPVSWEGPSLVAGAGETAVEKIELAVEVVEVG